MKASMSPQILLSLFDLSMPSLLLLLPLTILVLRIAASFNKRDNQLPPSPPKLPIIGNLHQLGSLPHRSLRALSATHGPLMFLCLGRTPTLVASSAAVAKEIMSTKDPIFASRPSSKITTILLSATPDLVFAPYGDYWRQARKLCVIHLLSIKKVASFRDVRAEEVSFLMETVSSQAAVGGVINMSDALNSFANNVICRVVSGKLEGRNELFQKLIEENSALVGSFHVGDYLPWLAWMDMFLGLKVRAKRNAKRWGVILDEVLEDHDSRLTGVGREGHDFTDVLLSLQRDSTIGFEFTKEHIKSLLMDMFGAGTDTTYILLEWAMAELVRNPKVMKKLQEELRKLPNRGSNAMIREEDLNELQYLKAVLKETLRLHPPVPLLVPRESIEDCQIQGYMIPKKTRVIINAWAIGRDPESWEVAYEFQPERFMEGGASLIEFKGSDFQLIPFGAGRRICPGMNFSVSTAELALGNLVSKFDWELPDGRRGEELDMAESPGITMRKKHKLHLVAKTCLC